MTVLILMPVATRRGGAEELLRRFVCHDAVPEEWVVAFFEDGPLRRVLADHGVQTRVIQAGRLREPHRYVRTVWRIARLSQAVGADLVFSWMPKAHLYGSWAAQWAGVPAAWYQHGAPELGWMDRLLTLQPAQAVVTCSRYVAEQQGDLWPRRPTRVVRPCVDLEQFRPEKLPSPREARARLALPRNGPVVGMVGRMQAWKGVHTFIRAFSCIRDAHPDAHGVIVGGKHPLEPDYTEQVDELIRDLGLEASISRVGHQPNVPRWMQAMDVVVHASDSEPFGMVIIEAMALQKPVVAGASGGPREIIEAGETGLFAPYEDSDRLSTQILKLLDHPKKAREMGRAARQRALDFSADRFARRLTAALRTIADVPA